ncbi:hypothetical protein J3459_010065 [Metarhizium acridum]|nr:hypothetical protein J3459_010065 [Metarhizium acridum]
MAGQFSFIDTAPRQLKAEIPAASCSSKAAQYKEDYIGSSKQVLSDPHRACLAATTWPARRCATHDSFTERQCFRAGQRGAVRGGESATSREEAVKLEHQP